MLHEGPIAAEPRQDHLAVLGMGADLARQAQQAQALFQVHGRGRPGLGQAGALGLVAFAQLHIGAKPAALQIDDQPSLGIGPQLAIAIGGVGLVALGLGDGPGEAAFGIVGAADEGAELAGLQRQPTGAAGRTGSGIGAVALVGEDVRTQGVVQGVQHVGDAQLGDFADGGVEVLPELPQQHLPVQFPGRDQVELLLQGGGEVVLHITAEELLEEGGDQPALVLGHEPVLVHLHIVAVAQHGQHRGVGRGPADAELLHLLDQAGFRIAGRRLGEVLGGAGGGDLGARPLGHLGQAAGFLVVGVVAALLVDRQIAVEQDHLAGGPQAGLAIGALQLDGGALDAGALHLGGDHPLPDQLVEPAKISVQPQGAGIAGQAGGSDCFVGLLGVLGLGAIDARLLGHIVLAVDAGDDHPGLVQGLGRGLDAVGPHVGDQADGLAADVHALIELLGGLHGALSREAELAGSLLLQGRGGEGRCRRALGRLLLHRGDGEAGGLDGGLGGFGGGLVAQVELGQALGLMLDQAGHEGVAPGRHVGVDRPVFLGLEPLDLELAVDDQAQGHRLHPAGRARTRQLAPQHRRKGEAHQVVQGAAGEVGLDQLHVDVPRGLHGLGDGGLGDGVEHHPLDLGALDDLLLLKDLQHVPGDGLAFAVGVGGQDQAVGPLHRLGDVVEPFGGLGVHVPAHGEVLVRSDGAILGRQIAHMAVRGEYDIVAAQVLVDGLGLGRALDNDDVHLWGFD